MDRTMRSEGSESPNSNPDSSSDMEDAASLESKDPGFLPDTPEPEVVNINLLLDIGKLPRSPVNRAIGDTVQKHEVYFLGEPGIPTNRDICELDRDVPGSVIYTANLMKRDKGIARKYGLDIEELYERLAGVRDEARIQATARKERLLKEGEWAEEREAEYQELLRKSDDEILSPDLPPPSPPPSPPVFPRLSLHLPFNPVNMDDYFPRKKPDGRFNDDAAAAERPRSEEMTLYRPDADFHDTCPLPSATPISLFGNAPFSQLDHGGKDQLAFDHLCARLEEETGDLEYMFDLAYRLAMNRDEAAGLIPGPLYEELSNGEEEGAEISETEGAEKSDISETEGAEKSEKEEAEKNEKEGAKKSEKEEAEKSVKEEAEKSEKEEARAGFIKIGDCTGENKWVVVDSKVRIPKDLRYLDNSDYRYTTGDPKPLDEYRDPRELYTTDDRPNGGFPCENHAKCECFDYSPTELPKTVMFNTTDGRGIGLRALRNIKKGEYIGEYRGVIEVYDNNERRPEALKAMKERDLRYTIGGHWDIGTDFGVDEDGHRRSFSYYVDALTGGTETRFINHHCDAERVNVEHFNENHKGRMAQVIRTTKAIPMDEEVLIDYGAFDEWRGYGGNCLCRSEACRYLVGAGARGSYVVRIQMPSDEVIVEIVPSSVIEPFNATARMRTAQQKRAYHLRYEKLGRLPIFEEPERAKPQRGVFDWPDIKIKVVHQQHQPTSGGRKHQRYRWWPGSSNQAGGASSGTASGTVGGP